jgi:hypothetical protein
MYEKTMTKTDPDINEETVKPLIGMWTDSGAIYGKGTTGKFNFMTSVSKSNSD